MSASLEQTAVAASGFDADLAALRPQLLRLARLQLRDENAAEDVVQDCFAAALANSGSFAGRAALTTWVTSILRHKIVDCIRARIKERMWLAEDAGEDFDADLFQADGHWVEPPTDWGDPERTLSGKRFIAALEACLDSLPQRHAQVFILRETMDMETAEICQELGISATNCAAMLSRARMRLRECLQLSWFGQS